MLKTIYDEMWDSSYSKIKSGQCDIDKLISDPNDTRRGVTALTYLQNNESKVSRKITEFLCELKKVEPKQYYYPEEELHLTILSIISCISGFQLADIDTFSYVQIFKQCMQDTESISIKFEGITISTSCILIQGFPIGEGLNELRNKLRNRYQESSLHTTIDSRYRLSTAHVTAVRFTSQLINRDKVIDVLNRYKFYDFGTMTFTEFQLVFNNWYQNLSETKQLASSSVKQCV
ncbi:hypothetical protein LZS85_12370 [Aliivibrio fischeri]|uniref:hypothetical protein n=1 Tax=Aliivibrio fischeri TaxID=668 RepID=UPI002E33DBFC|nr:hypothetical protein [Aliivibrio fischeri]MCE7566911.1 hypothetical protein [Aliivibrio fischeri]